MSKLFMELDNAVDRVIRLSEQHGDLSKYDENEQDREWLRNELEQICYPPNVVGPLPEIVYLCDGEACGGNCATECHHTHLIDHAINFECFDGKYIEKEKERCLS